MKARFLALAFVAMLAGMVSAQGPPTSDVFVVTGEAPLKLQAWRAGPSGFEKVWEARPRGVDPATWDKRKGETVTSDRDGNMVAADYDGDGTKELLAIDAYGITVYGRNPRYLPFEIAGGSRAPVSLAVGDVDGDKTAELITYRRIDAGYGVEIFKVTPSGLTSLWKQKPDTSAITSFALAVGDVDTDGQNEILVGATLMILKKGTGPSWEVMGDLPSLGALADDAVVADVDGDGKNEIVAGGNSSRVTVYTYRKVGAKNMFPVLWQSGSLVSNALKPYAEGGRVTCYVASIDVGDVEGDKKPELVVTTVDGGVREDKKPANGRIHVFAFEPQTSTFMSQWVSGPTSESPSVHATVVADVDADGINEIVFNAHDIYKRASDANTYRLTTTLANWTKRTGSPTVAIGAFGELREPASSTRVIPLYWTAGRELAQGDAVETTVTLFSPWNDAKDVAVKVLSDNERITVTDGAVSVGAISAGTTATTKKFRLAANGGTLDSKLRLEITAAGGYRQVVPLQLAIGAPFPAFESNVESRIATALTKARSEYQRVLVQWGSKGDAVSENLMRAIRKDYSTSETLTNEYRVVGAEIKGSERIAAKYKVDPKAGLPYLTVLDLDGKVVVHQSAVPFKAEGDNAAAYDAKKVNAFLTKSKTPLNADTLLKSALTEAKKDQKTLFVWFSAPW
jgi:hypothetical protein